MAKKKVEKSDVVVAAPNLRVIRIPIRGTAPYMSNAFSQKAKELMRLAQQAGSTTKKGKKREPKDFEADYHGSLNTSREGWYGFNAAGLRTAMVDACRMCGFKMTHAKMSVTVEADGYTERGDPLVKFTKGKPHMDIRPVENANGSVDLRARGMFDPGWEAVVSLRYDADQFTETDVANLLVRAGLQVGVGAGRPYSKNSAGQGWGTFVPVSMMSAYSEAAD